MLWLSACAAGQAEAPARFRPPLPEPVGAPAPAVEEGTVLEPAPLAKGTTAIVGGTLLVGDGTRIENGVLVLTDGKIAAVGPSAEVSIPEGARSISAEGQFVSPGLIDTHSHMGVYPVPFVDAHADGNEMTDPTTPYVFSEHAFWPQDPSIDDAVAGGVTTIQVLPGSGNVIGGRATVLKLRARREARAMRFPGAPFGLKMACGENPKRVYGRKGVQPMSRMGSIFKLRQAFLQAREYRAAVERHRIAHRRWEEKLAHAREHPDAEVPGDEPMPPKRDLGAETLVAAMAGDIRIHVHCYRADEMLLMLSLADELGFRVASFHHAVEAYKIADVLAKRGVAASVWSDWWGFKMEAYDAVEANAAMLDAAGGRPVIHSDSPIGIQRLNQDAAKALTAGRRLGLDITRDAALAWVTKNPAEALGIAEMVGTLAPGKMADVVIWDAEPLSIQARAVRVMIDGVTVLDRREPRRTGSDFDVGSEVEVLR